MSDQPQPSGGSPGDTPVAPDPKRGTSTGTYSAAVAAAKRVRGEPITQEKPGWRNGWPNWMQQLPRLRFPPPDSNFQLIDLYKLDTVMSTVETAAAERIKDDIQFLEREVMQFFRARDYEAKRQQNRYRLYQLGYIVLAATATLIGSLQALALSQRPPSLVIVFALAETLVALIATFLATISGREPPFSSWMTNRRRAESLRQEYFRYLLNMPPYDQLDGFQRRLSLSKRAADINRGVFSDDTK